MISISRDSIQKPMCMFKKENCERKVWTCDRIRKICSGNMPCFFYRFSLNILISISENSSPLFLTCFLYMANKNEASFSGVKLSFIFSRHIYTYKVSHKKCPLAAFQPSQTLLRCSEPRLLRQTDILLLNHSFIPLPIWDIHHTAPSFFL